jgi:hypothetical protein
MKLGIKIMPFKVTPMAYFYFEINVFNNNSIIRVIKLRRMRWAGHIARVGQERCM